MKNNITSQLRNVNPIELFRAKQELSQQEFAEKLGYTSAGSYRQHRNTFSRDILGRISELYGTDLRDEVICHLRTKLKSAESMPDSEKAGKGSPNNGSSYADMVG